MAFRIQKKWHWLVALGAVFVPGIVTGALSLPFTFSAGKPIRASEVNANFEALRAKLDGLSSAPVRPTVGTLTIAGLGTALPIRKFTQSITAPSVRNGSTVKPTFSDVQVVLDVGASAPQINSAISLGKVLASADIVLGSLSLHLTSVVLDHLTEGPPQSGVAQQTLSFSYQTVDWSWQAGTGAKRVVSYNLGSNIGGGSAVKKLSYGYFAPGVAVDSTYFPVSGYTHDIVCPPTAKCTQGPLSIQKTIGGETLDELGLITAGTAQLAVDLEWFLAAGTASNSIQLANGLIVGVALTTNDDGTFAESVDYSYGQITWRAGTTSTTFDASGAQAT